MLGVGITALIAPLAACGRLDVHDVKDDLQAAIEAVPQCRGGQIHFTDDVTQGTVISGTVGVIAEDRAEATAGFEAVLEALAEAYPTGIGVNAADVELTGNYDDDASPITAADVLTGHGPGKITTDDLREHFGL